MKVKIGNFPDHKSSYKLEIWLEETLGMSEKWSERIAYPYQLGCDLYNFIMPSEQKISVKLDRWDTWNLDCTLAHIVTPMLKQLKEQKHGAPHVDKEDTPERLWPPINKDGKPIVDVDDGNLDKHYFERWDYVMDEMIWAFEQKTLDWEEQFYSGEPDIVFEKIEGSDLSEVKHGPRNTFEVDRDGMRKHSDRMANGLRLFAKYYNGLWD